MADWANVKIPEYLPHHFPAGQRAIFSSRDSEMYGFKVLIGKHEDIELEEFDSAWLYEEETGIRSGGMYGRSGRGPCVINSGYCCTIVRGYAPQDRTACISTTNLPYVNGCSTESLLPPIRLGDPTMQILYMPPNSSEQQHHIHSTVRVVFILEGSATNVYGMGVEKTIPLNRGDVLILDKILPHHFVTKDEPLVCSPFHVWSSVGAAEHNHPMFNGTHMTG